MGEYYLHTKHLATEIPQLKAGDRVFLSGTVYTARDAAHKRLIELLEKGEPLPFPVKGATLYYAGPTPAPAHMPIGSCGPTTSSRMDRFTPRLLEEGLLAMIGKGSRSPAVSETIRKCGAVYFCAIGGAGALAAECIEQCEVVAYSDLGCESIKRLEFVKFPLVVGIDSSGRNLFS